MLYGVIGFIVGNLFGVMLMCLLQINRSDEGGVNDEGGSERTESEKEERTIEELLSELAEEGSEEIR